MDLNVIKATELTLRQPGTDSVPRVIGKKPSGKRPFTDIATDSIEIGDSHPPPAKSQVVGWPPITTFRKNCCMAKKAAVVEAEGLMYVKVSMDGAPYLRKIDLKVYAGYKELIKALGTMFKCFIKGDFVGKECCNKSEEFALTYEDKDEDWMLVGDVPFEMFITSCKRLRIVKKSEAQGLGSL